jgi:hypothetical protein
MQFCVYYTCILVYVYVYIEERSNVYKVLVGKPEGNRQRGRPRHIWEDNIKMDLEEVGWGAWTGLIWLRRGTGGGHL